MEADFLDVATTKPVVTVFLEPRTAPFLWSKCIFGLFLPISCFFVSGHLPHLPAFGRIKPVFYR